MNKRKASADRNGKQKASSRRPSTSSLHAKANIARQKFHKPERLPSTHNLVEAKNSSQMVTKAVDVCMPKTGYTSQDRGRDFRSCSSPRLKYFPAEKIKKLDSPPPFSPKPIGALIAQQDPEESGVVYVAPHAEQRCDNGQGDAAAATQHFHQHRQHPGMHSASQQQVMPQQATHQIGQINPHSECVLPQKVPNLQSHRPFVPHGSRECSPLKNPHATFPNPTQITPGVQQVPNSSGPLIDQGKTENREQMDAAEADYERQPVGGRNAAVYRKIMTYKPGQATDSAALNQANMNYQRVQDHNRTSSSHANAQNPQQIYQQLQQNMAQQQQMQHRAANYQYTMGNQQQMEGGQRARDYNAQQVGRYFLGQDQSNVNRSRTMGVVQRNYPAHYTNPQNGWSNGNHVAEYTSAKAQLKSYNMDVVNGNQPLHPMPNQQQQQFVAQYQEQQQLVPQYNQQLVNQQQQAAHQQLYRNPTPGSTTMQRQQNTVAHDQPVFNQQMSSVQQSNPRQPSDNEIGNPETQRGRKKPLKFTVGMVRDQEKLLATMKQQGVPMDIMRRQFETLLNEQRKHLEYLEQIQRQDAPDDAKRPMAVPRKRKNQDEKPEWMIHLTPPRLSYMEIEMLNEQRKRGRETHQTEPMQQQHRQEQSYQNQQQHRQEQSYQNQQQQQYQHQLQQQHTVNEVSGQQIPAQAANQQNYQHWQQPDLQQQQRISQQYSNVQSQPYVVSGPGNANEVPKQVKYEQNVLQYRHQPTHQYPYQQPRQQHYNTQLLQQQQQHYQPVSQRNQEQIQPAVPFPTYEENRPSAESSSLLKMRRYKNEIRPQRQNNGLQDPEAAKKQLENLRASSNTRKGLEYLANLTTKMPATKLNGMQHRNDVEAEFQQRLITSTIQPSVKKVSANGLENSRQPNNPPTQRLSNLKRMQQEYLREYPRQKQNNQRNCYSVQAEKENGSTAIEQPQVFLRQQFPGQNSTNVIPYNEKNPLVARENVTSFRFDGNNAPHYQLVQQYYQNTRNLGRNSGEGDVGSTRRVEQSKGNFDHAAGDASENMNGTVNGQLTEGKMPIQRMYYNQPDIHEARTIGGVRYLARKQDYLPNQQIVVPETPIASRHAQPLMMY